MNPGYKDLATREEKTQFDTIRYNNEGRRHDDQVRLISRLLGGVQQNTTRLKHVSSGDGDKDALVQFQDVLGRCGSVSRVGTSVDPPAQTGPGA